MPKYEMIDIDSDEFYLAINDFYNRCKKDREKHDEDVKEKTIAERIELHNQFYEKQKRYANDLFNHITEDENNDQQLNH